MILSEYLPERSADDIVAGRIRVRFGEDEFVLPVLTIAENESWQEQAKDHLLGLFTGFAALDDAGAIFARFAALTDVQIVMLTSYDRTGVLPSVEDIRKTATPDAVLRAALEVLAASYPTLAVALDLAVRNPATLRTLMEQGAATMAATSSTSTNGSRRGTAGRRLSSVSS